MQIGKVFYTKEGCYAELVAVNPDDTYPLVVEVEHFNGEKGTYTYTMEGRYDLSKPSVLDLEMF